MATHDGMYTGRHSDDARDLVKLSSHKKLSETSFIGL